MLGELFLILCHPKGFILPRAEVSQGHTWGMHRLECHFMQQSYKAATWLLSVCPPPSHTSSDRCLQQVMPEPQQLAGVPGQEKGSARNTNPALPTAISSHDSWKPLPHKPKPLWLARTLTCMHRCEDQPAASGAWPV